MEYQEARDRALKALVESIEATKETEKKKVADGRGLEIIASATETVFRITQAETSHPQAETQATRDTGSRCTRNQRERLSVSPLVDGYLERLRAHRDREQQNQ